MPPDSDWQRLHPLSPFLRAGRFVLVTAALLGDDIAARLDFPAPVAALALLGAMVVGAVAGWWAWATTRYRVTAEEVELRTGIVFRRHRRMPLARLESIDIGRPLAARLFGLAQVRLEAVSDSESEVRLSYLDYDAAIGLREELGARLDETRAPVDGTGETAAPPGGVVTVPTRELVLSTVAGRLAGGVPGVLVGTVAALAALGPGEAAAFLAFAGFFLVVTGVVEAERLYGFTLTEGTGGLQIKRGLLNEMHQRVPIDRIQAVSVIEPLLWRPFRRARLAVDVAGYRGGKQEDRARSSVLLPIGSAPVVAAVLHRVQPGLRLDELSHARAPSAARWRAPLRWRRYSVAWNAHHAVTRRGMLRRRTDIVPHVKVQSLRVTQGPWQRILGLATLHLDTAGTQIRARAPHRRREDAERLAWASREAAASRPNRDDATSSPP